MAYTLLYSHAPAPVFDNLHSATWSAPSLELTSLWEMSQSLQKGDWEITPVQAWFMLTAAFDVSSLLGGEGARLEALRKGLGKVVSCFGFGAVMDVLKFWDVVNDVMGQDGTIQEKTALRGVQDPSWI
jgi:hypothetical protein